MTTRREFLLAGASAGAMAGCGPLADAAASHRAVVAAIVPAILEGALPAASAERSRAIAATVAGVDRAIAGLAPATQREIGQLFDLLAFAPTRVLVAGVGAPWGTARPNEIAVFLDSWRHSRFALLRTGYAGLHDLVLGAWYAQPESWAAIGYPGPPALSGEGATGRASGGPADERRRSQGRERPA